MYEKRQNRGVVQYLWVNAKKVFSLTRIKLNKRSCDHIRIQMRKDIMHICWKGIFFIEMIIVKTTIKRLSIFL
jgi:hypothetical protein